MGKLPTCDKLFFAFHNRKCRGKCEPFCWHASYNRDWTTPQLTCQLVKGRWQLHQLHQ